ncbi:MAG: phosphoribosyltransferase [Chloroflexi bacterium]|nr:phosphoribosyltransferase [Chloroflexota bacterium]
METLRIVSRSSEPFKDRVEAGQLLARELQDLRGNKAVVLGIPRGGIVVARELARGIDAELDVIISRKLRAPAQPELAIGSVSEDGKVFLNESVVQDLSVADTHLEQEKARQMVEIARLKGLIRGVLPKVPLKGRIVVVTDDGVATGATTQAAFWAVRQEEPAKLIAALPVGPEETLRRLAKDVDEMICLRVPRYLFAVGQFYIRFGQVEDEEVLEILKEVRNKKTPAPQV